MRLPHYEQVDIGNIKAVFSADGKHRTSLTIPFRGRQDRRTLCIIGQNPSEANAEYADKTVRYIEEYVWKRQEQYGALAIVNLYSRVDTNKAESDSLSTPESDIELQKIIDSCTDVLALFGKLGNSEPYNFLARAAEVRKLLLNKQVYKLAIGSVYAPHPGNTKIIYSNFEVELDAYGFGDICT